MGFKEDRGRMLEALRQGHVIHEERSYQEEKNLLATGQLSEDEAAAILGSVRGDRGHAQPSKHHYDAKQKIWIMTTTVTGVTWYIKAYLPREEARVVFLSFHHSKGEQS